MSVPSPPHLSPKYDWHCDNERIGRKIAWEDKKGRRIAGLCTGCQFAGSTIYDMKTGEEWVGIRFRIQPADGTRAVWTTAFPDKSRPVPSPA